MASGICSLFRWIVFIMNFLFWLAGLGVLGVALLLRFDPDVSNFMGLNDGMSNFYLCCYILMGVGLLMTILGFLGCCGALKQSQCMLASFFILLLIVFCAELACAILAYRYQEQLESFVEKSMYETINNKYDKSVAHTKMFDAIQRNLKCCGVRSYTDWLGSYYSSNVALERPDIGVGSTDVGRVPKSCCNERGIESYPTNCGTSFNRDSLSTYANFLHKDGCKDVLFDEIYDHLGTIICCSVIIGALQLLGMFCTMLFCCWLNREDERERKREEF